MAVDVGDQQARIRNLPVRSNPTHEKEHEEDDQNDAEDTDAAVTVAIAVAAEPATEATNQEDDENDDKNSVPVVTWPQSPVADCQLAAWFRQD